ncbi:anti-repressor SinI family protein [Bacillus sp. RAR_GA_16]|nr:anti-repressor SinI family protein [Bacillus sp. RAR_GA_16]MCA0170453.1 anti-repressor SinI family protein [Bacillus sp. RAR_GA_16]
MGVHTEKKLDDEWVELIKEAKELGISISEIQSFLRHQSN